MNYVIISDAACDLESSMMEQINLGFISMEYIQESETHEYNPSDSSEEKKKIL